MSLLKIAFFEKIVFKFGIKKKFLLSFYLLV